jgi:hypothetical protein
VSHWEQVRSAPVPDLWPDIERRLTGPDPGRPGRAGRAVSVVAGTLLIGGLLVWALVALSGLGSHHQPEPSAPLSARIPVNEPQPLVAGEGAVWVVGGTTVDGNTLWRIDPATNTSTELTQTRGAMWPAAGEGWAWVTVCHPGGLKEECSSNDLLKIDPRTGETVATIRLPSYPFVVYAGLGAVWVSTVEGLVKVDPVTDAVAAVFPVKTDLLGSAGGYLWATATQHSDFSGLARIDAESGRVVSSVGFRDPCLLLATDQGVWVASCRAGEPPGAPPDRLVRIDPSTGGADLSVPLDQWGSMAFANGSLWLGHWVGDQVVIEGLDPNTGTPTGAQVEVRPGPKPWGQSGFGPASVGVITADGSFWLTHVDANDVVREPIPAAG